MYEGLASYFLPTVVLEYFEVTDFAEVPTQDTEVLYTTELHIYLDERDNRTPDMSGSVSDGFGEESCLLDFPTRDKKTGRKRHFESISRDWLHRGSIIARE